MMGLQLAPDTGGTRRRARRISRAGHVSPRGVTATAISHHPWTRYGDTKTSRMAQEEFEEYTAAGVRVGAG
jgi:hypothetical protein